MNTEGKQLLYKLGFPPPYREQFVTPDNFRQMLNLDALYSDSRCGASIQAGSIDVKLSHGPNGFLGVLKGAHNVPRERFFESFYGVVESTRKKGVPIEKQVIAVSQSIPPCVYISGICARIDEGGFGYLSCEVLDGVRHGDFTPDYSITDEVVGGRRIMQNRAVNGQITALPSWVQQEMFWLMKALNCYEECIAGIEVVFDTERKRTVCHDFYLTRQNDRELLAKFHLDKR